MPTVVAIVGIVLIGVAAIVFYMLSRPDPSAVYKATDETSTAAPRGGAR